MKTNVIVYVDDRKKTGKCPVYIKVSRGRNERFLVNTGLTSKTKFEGRQFPRSETASTAKTNMLNDIFLQVEEMVIRNEKMPMRELKQAIQKKVFGKNGKEKLFVDYCHEYALGCSTPGTAGLYEQTARKVASYDADATFDTMTASWMREFDKFCSRTMSINGMGVVMRNIRTVFNKAVKDKVTSNYPFSEYKIKAQRTKKRSLTVEQLRALKDYPVEPWQEEYRDLFMLQFYLIGINISDLLELEHLTDGRCVYYRNKTGRLYDIKVEPEAMAIIEKYKGKEHLLRPLDRYASVNDYIHHMNDALKKIGPHNIVPDKLGRLRKVEYNPLFPELTTYWNRHTWATIAASIDIPIDVIGRALGHAEWERTTTDIYINFDNRKIDEANRKVIDYVNNV